MTGLHIVANRRTNPPTWYVYAWRGGPRIHTAEGAKPAITPEILDLASAARRERSSAPQGTFEWLCGQYRAGPEFTRLADSTQKDYRRWLDRACAKFGEARLAVFEDRRCRGAIVEWRDQWRGKPRSADMAVAVMANVLGWALQRGMLAINVAAGIPHLHRADRSDKIWTAADWAALEALDPKGRPVAGRELLHALRLASLTGLRRGDLLALTWEQVGPKAIVITTAKRARRAVIPILPELARLLEEIQPSSSESDRAKRTGTVLRNTRGKAWTTSGFSTMFQRARNAAGLEVRLHDLRGTFITFLAQKGLTNEEIARIAAWSPRAVEAIRLRYVDELRVVTSLTERLKA